MKRAHRDARRLPDDAIVTLYEAGGYEPGAHEPGAHEPGANPARDPDPSGKDAARGCSDAASEMARLRAEVAQLASDLQSVRAQLGALCELERFRDVVLERYPAQTARPPRTRRLDARDFVENADGFHNLEYDVGGVAYRWTGPGHFTRVRFHVDRSASVMVVLRLSSLGRHAAHDRITVDVDGTVYPMRALGGEGIALVAGPVQPNATAGLTDLFFHIPVTFAPRDEGVDDARILGVAVMSIEVEPAG